MRAASPGYRLATRLGVAVFAGLGLVLTVLVHEPALARPMLARLAGAPTPANPTPLRRLDPTCRLRGWRTLAAGVDRVRDELRARGTEPVLAGTAWNLPGEIGFYGDGHPMVYSLGPALGDRHSQYDLWHPNPLADVEAFRGRTFIVVGVGEDVLRPAFDRVEPMRLVTHYEAGQPIAVFAVVVGHGYRGFPARAANAY
jgi:hypothetical protein